MRIILEDPRLDRPKVSLPYSRDGGSARIPFYMVV